MFTTLIPDNHPLTSENHAQEVYVVMRDDDAHNVLGVYSTFFRAFLYIREWEQAAGGEITGPFPENILAGSALVVDSAWFVKVNGFRTYTIHKTSYRL